MAKIGPESSPASLAKIDGRTREGRLVRGLRNDLIAHVGGRPSATQRVLIARATQLALRIALMDREMENGGPLADHATRTYLAWSNSLTRTLRDLGMKPSRAMGPASGVTLQDYIAERAAA